MEDFLEPFLFPLLTILNSAGRRDNFKCVSGFSSVCELRISLIFLKSFFINILYWLICFCIIYSLGREGGRKGGGGAREKEGFQREEEEEVLADERLFNLKIIRENIGVKMGVSAFV